MGMMDIFKKAYDRQEAAQAVYDKATETEKEVLRNEYSEMMNEVENACENSEDKRAAIQLWHAYETMRKRGNKYMDFDMVDEDRAAELAHAMKENGVKTFTYSSSWSSAVNTALIFKEMGYRVTDVVEINSGHVAWGDERAEKIPAYMFTID